MDPEQEGGFSVVSAPKAMALGPDPRSREQDCTAQSSCPVWRMFQNGDRKQGISKPPKAGAGDREVRMAPGEK